VSKREFVPISPRICSRCALGHDEPWRLACPRCGGVVVVNEDRGLFFRIVERARRDGWERGRDARSPERASRYQLAHPPTHQPLSFPLTRTEGAE
jgi:hypothetical protein